MRDLIGPDIQNSLLAHAVHVLLIGGVVVYGWQTVSALVRRPRSVARALRKAVNAAWLAVLLLILIKPNPLSYMSVFGALLVLRLVLALWDRSTAPAKGEELLTSGAAGEFGRENERVSAAIGVRRD